MDKTNPQDISRMMVINLQVAKLEDKIRSLKKEANEIWKRNDNEFELENVFY